jgi:hypothetical protein
MLVLLYIPDIYKLYYITDYNLQEATLFFPLFFNINPFFTLKSFKQYYCQDVLKLTEFKKFSFFRTPTCK